MKKILITILIITGINAIDLEVEGEMTPECAEDIKANKKEWSNCSKLTQKDKDKIRAVLSIRDFFLKRPSQKDTNSSLNKTNSYSPESD
ncbi:MAG: hypothetical protein J7L08_02370 [Candidatus Aenigmarchaeota archaeon]|nr:hypothetical protein [Candidatus Aenigmarchaeota archaeon]